MAKDTREPSEVVESISGKAATTRQAAATLTNHIHDFREYLGRLKGRVETRTFGRHPDFDPESPFPVSLGLLFHRVDKEWELSWGTYSDAHPEREPDWAPLATSPLPIKAAAVDLFPGLLASMDRTQDEVIAEITKASRRYQDFAKKLGIASKEVPSE